MGLGPCGQSGAAVRSGPAHRFRTASQEGRDPTGTEVTPSYTLSSLSVRQNQPGRTDPLRSCDAGAEVQQVPAGQQTSCDQFVAEASLANSITGPCLSGAASKACAAV